MLNRVFTDLRATSKEALAISSIALPERPLLHASLGNVSTTLHRRSANVFKRSFIASRDLSLRLYAELGRSPLRISPDAIDIAALASGNRLKYMVEATVMYARIWRVKKDEIAGRKGLCGLISVSHAA